jgi:hypothetical protein
MHFICIDRTVLQKHIDDSMIIPTIVLFDIIPVNSGARYIPTFVWTGGFCFGTSPATSNRPSNSCLVLSCKGQGVGSSVQGLSLSIRLHEVSELNGQQHDTFSNIHFFVFENHQRALQNFRF